MLPCYSQRNPVYYFSLHNQVIGRSAKFVICNVSGCIITGRILSEGDYAAVQSPGNFLHPVNIFVDHQKASCRKLLCKQTEGMTDIRDILKEIQMILFNI